MVTGPQEDEEALWHRRRAALQRALDKNGLNVEQACKLAGLKGSGAVGNFMRGLSKSLNLAALEILAVTLRTTVSELIGEHSVDELKEGVACDWVGVISFGKWEPTIFLAEEEWKLVAMGGALRTQPQKPIRVMRLDSAEMDLVYPPERTELFFIDFDDYDGTLSFGRRVIVLRENVAGLFEKQVREIAATDNPNQCRLVTRSSQDRLNDLSWVCPWPIPKDFSFTEPSGEMVMILGVIVSHRISEE